MSSNHARCSVEVLDNRFCRLHPRSLSALDPPVALHQILVRFPLVIPPASSIRLYSIAERCLDDTCLNKGLVNEGLRTEGLRTEGLQTANAPCISAQINDAQDSSILGATSLPGSAGREWKTPGRYAEPD